MYKLLESWLTKNEIIMLMLFNICMVSCMCFIKISLHVRSLHFDLLFPIPFLHAFTVWHGFIHYIVVTCNLLGLYSKTANELDFVV